MIRSNRKQGMYESSPVTFHLRLLCGKLVAAAAGEVLVLVVWVSLFLTLFICTKIQLSVAMNLSQNINGNAYV